MTWCSCLIDSPVRSKDTPDVSSRGSGLFLRRTRSEPMTTVATTISPATLQRSIAFQPGRVVSNDGTLIAYDRIGAGPPVILVDGALCSRALGPMPGIARLLAERFSVFTYDRRGRGDSGDTAPYAVERELDDLDALIREAGGAAHVFGISSGAVLALTAAARGLRITRLAVYEAPFIV